MKTALFLAASLALAAQADAAQVGFTQIDVPDSGHQPITVGIWYPTRAPAQSTQIGTGQQSVAQGAPLAGKSLPLILISHGSGGDFASHADTAYALAAAGFVVAAPTQNGDTWRDESHVTDVPERPREFVAVDHFMVTAWMPGAIDPARVGAFGFSAGGMTVLIAAGATPNLATFAPHCAAHPAFFDCQIVHRTGPLPKTLPASFAHADNLRALVIAAPAIGFTFGKPGLAPLTMPIQLWRANDDQVLPPAYYADAVHAALPRPPEFHPVPHAGHYDFLDPCSPILAHANPQICGSEPGFSRIAFHRQLNAAIVRFFRATLRR